MKKYSTLLKVSLLAGILSVGCYTQAQVVAPPAIDPTNATNAASASPTQFYSTAFDWFSSDNTNLDISAINLELSQGYIQPAGAGALTETAGQYNFQSKWNINASIQYLGAGSAINHEDIGGGYAIYRGHSIRADADLTLGYGYNNFADMKRFEITPKIFLEKLFTATTYGRTGFGLPMGFKGPNTTAPQVYIEVGFGVLRGSQH